jgi:hypothetical protein
MNNLDMRMTYENAKQVLMRAFPNVPNILEITKLTQSTYRFEQPLIAGNTQYQFPVLVNESVFSNTEKRLKQQDSAIVNSLAMFVAAPSSATDAAFKLFSYPNTIAFTTNAAPLQALYNGNLSLAVNNDILIPNWDLFKHYYCPETQQTDALGAASPGDELNGAENAFYPVEPNIVLVGSKNNVINITLPVGITTVAANSRIVLIARCITAQNSTVVS